jgi:hypothetical protein
VFGRKKKPSAEVKTKVITELDIERVDAAVTAVLGKLPNLQNIDQDELESQTAKGRSIVRSWIEEFWKQWQPPSSPQ